MSFDHIHHSKPNEISVRALVRAGQSDAWRLALPHHRRACHLLVWITRGQGLALLDGTRTGVGANTLLYFPAGQLLAFEAGRQAEGQLLSVPVYGISDLPDTPAMYRVADRSDQGELTAQFDAISREQDQQRPRFRAATQARTDLIVIMLHRLIEVSLPDVRRDPATRHLSRAFCQQLTGDSALAQNIAGHAAVLGVSPAHLNRACKAETGMTATRLLGDRKLSATRQFLDAADRPLAELARHLGFSGSAALSRFIKHRTGRTPTQLRHAQRSRPAGDRI